ncbi:MAG: 2-oxoacid:acceptor oxidoreductase family protein [Planctomycetes bacterium]|nr:2-oxoacid:acceptor oxidoreductase family protein [Planctomycetota bacterium]
MQTEVIMAGFGGQGVITAGYLLAQAALAEEREVTWLPSYGPEMRGGTANCTVVVGDEPIGSPLVSAPKVAVVMNRPSLEKFAPKLKPGGLLVVDSCLIPIRSDRTDIREFRIRADDLAVSAGSRKGANLAMLGALLGILPLVSRETAEKIIGKHFAKKPQFIESNLQAFLLGFEQAKAGKSDE